MNKKIDKALLENILKEKILSSTQSIGCQVGDNVAGELDALHLITESGKDYHLVVKWLPPVSHVLSRGWAVDVGVFWNEHGVYKTLAPMLNDLAQQHGFDTYELPMPKYYTGFNDNENDYLCLQDERINGFKMQDKYKGFNFLETSLVLKELASFHALTYFLIKYHGEKVFEEIEDMKRLKQEVEIIKPEEIQTKVYYRMYQKSIDLIQMIDAKLAEKMKSFLPMVGQLKNKTENSTDNQFFPVIVHGDFWINNILIKYDEKTGTPSKVKFLDFQFCRRGNIFLDLQYFIFTSTTPDFRKKYLPQVLDLYYDTFCSVVKKINCPPPPNFTKGFFIDNFYGCYPSAFVYMTFALPYQLTDLSNYHNVENFDSEDLSVSYMQNQIVYKKLSEQMEASQAAKDRLELIAREMEELNMF